MTTFTMPEASSVALRAPSIGAGWLALLEDVLARGERVHDEYLEVRGLWFEVPKVLLPDPILVQLADQAHVDEMRKVFHTREPNRFGHSYQERMHGPTPGNPLDTVESALRTDPRTRRAALTLVGSGRGDVPCVNFIQFLVRGGTVLALYFGRAQDLVNKIYADALCVYDLAEELRRRLGLESVGLMGSIASAHIYLEDVPRARSLLEAGKALREGRAS